MSADRFIMCNCSTKTNYHFYFSSPNLYYYTMAVSHCAANVVCVFLCAGKMGKRWKSGILNVEFPCLVYILPTGGAAVFDDGHGVNEVAHVFPVVWIYDTVW